MKSVALIFLSLAATAIGLPLEDPKAPALTYLFTANLTVSAPVSIGSTPQGSRAVVPFTGGAFSGPKLSGKIPAIGADWGLTDAKGNFSPDAMYVLQTTDGANIFVRGQGRIPNEAVVFETGSDKYAWLNTVVAVAQAKRVADGISIDVFQVGTVNLPSIADSCVA